VIAVGDLVMTTAAPHPRLLLNDFRGTIEG
jgi:hypothetical protein